ncbi:hypothetical protein BH11GEM1_BH11GEM1_09920 [soil metagenome]
MPLTPLQRDILATVGSARTSDSYLAGGAAIHFTPQSTRFSGDLDFFNDSVERVATAYAADQGALVLAGFSVDIEISQPGFVRAIVSKDAGATRIDWAHDSAWRFMPPVRDALGGYLLHDVDLAINKTLALAGRDEARDFVDIMYVNETVLPLAGLVWAAVGKDPGFSPLSLLELLKRRGRPRPEEVARLDLAAPFDLTSARTLWFAALADADAFVRSRPSTEIGCLYYSVKSDRFVIPAPDAESGDILAHYGRPGGVLPQPAERALGTLRPITLPDRTD